MYWTIFSIMYSIQCVPTMLWQQLWYCFVWHWITYWKQEGETPTRHTITTATEEGVCTEGWEVDVSYSAYYVIWIEHLYVFLHIHLSLVEWQVPLPYNINIFLSSSIKNKYNTHGLLWNYLYLLRTEKKCKSFWPFKWCLLKWFQIVAFITSHVFCFLWAVHLVNISEDRLSYKLCICTDIF